MLVSDVYDISQSCDYDLLVFHNLDIFLWIGYNFTQDLYQIIFSLQIKAWISSCTSVQM